MFEDREEAGRRLAARLLASHPRPDLVLGLPRGGVLVAAEVATVLGTPLEVLVARKLGAPDHPEYAVGAIAEAGSRALDARAASRYSPAALAEVERAERAELDRRVQVYRPERPVLDLHGRAVVVVDDGIATGATMIAACRAAEALGATRVTAAVPVAPPGWRAALGDAVDDGVALLEPEHFRAVGAWYRAFPQATDAQVLAALASTGRPAP